MHVVAPRGYLQHLGGMPLGCCSQLTPGQLAYVSIRQHTSAYVSILEACRLDVARSSHQVSLLLQVSIRPFVLEKSK